MIRNLDTRSDTSPIDMVQKCRGTITKSLKSIQINGQPRLVTVECYPNTPRNGQGSISAVALTQRQTKNIPAVGHYERIHIPERTDLERVINNQAGNFSKNLVSLKESSLMIVDNTDVKVTGNSLRDENREHVVARSVNRKTDIANNGAVVQLVFAENAISDLKNCQISGEGSCKRETDNVTPQSSSLHDVEKTAVQSFSTFPHQQQRGPEFNSQLPIVAKYHAPQLKISNYHPNHAIGKISVKNLPTVNKFTDKFKVTPKFQVRAGGKPLYLTKNRPCKGVPCGSAHRRIISESRTSYKPVVSRPADSTSSYNNSINQSLNLNVGKAAINCRVIKSRSNHSNLQDTSNNDQKSNTSSKITFIKTHPVIRLRTSSGESGQFASKSGVPFTPSANSVGRNKMECSKYSSETSLSRDGLKPPSTSATELEEVMFEQYLQDNHLEDRTAKQSGLLNSCPQISSPYPKTATMDKAILNDAVLSNYSFCGRETSSEYWPEQDEEPLLNGDMKKHDLVTSHEYVQSSYTAYDSGELPSLGIFEMIGE